MQVGTFFERRPGARDAEYAASCDDQERSSFLEMRAAILNGVPLFRIELHFHVCSTAAIGPPFLICTSPTKRVPN
jgi:hypothetical protein